MLRAILNRAAVESARRPPSQLTMKRSPTPSTTSAALHRTPLPSTLVTTANSACPPFPGNSPSPKLTTPGDRGHHNPMLTSLLESDALTPSGGTEVSNKKKTSAADIMTAMKRQSSVDEVFNGSTTSSRSAAAFHMNTGPQVSRSYSVPVPLSSPHPSVKLEPGSSLSMKPLMSTPVDHGRTFGTTRSSTSELINLLSSDSFSGSGVGTPGLSANKNQFDFKNGSSESLASLTGNSTGRTSAVSMDWSDGSTVDASVDWETSSTASDDLRQKSFTSKSSQVMRNNLTSSGIKTEPIVVRDDATVGLVAVQNKPLTVKFKRCISKPSTQRRSNPESDGTVDRAALKERAKTCQGAKLNSTTTDFILPESLDFEVDSLTSAPMAVVACSPGRSSASPRLPGGGTGLADVLKPGDKRPRVSGNKLIGSSAEKKRRSDEGRKMSRKIYEFDDDNEVFDTTGGTQSGKISTIKITKSEGRLQIQKSGAVVSPGGRPAHKSMSATSGQVTGSAVRLGRPPGFPPRPVRSKSLVTQKSESKAVGLPVPRMKPSPMVVSSGVALPTSSSLPKPAVSSTTAVTKPKTVQPTAKRKNSLSAVIEKLSKGASAGAESDRKVLYDDIRLAIIREGNKPSTPTREMSSSSSSLSRSGISSTKRPPDTLKEASVRLTVPARKPPVSSGLQGADAGRNQAGMVRFIAPPASPPSASSQQQTPLSLQPDVQPVPKIPREQTASLQSMRPNVAIARLSEAEAVRAGGRGTLMQPAVRMIRPPVSGTVLPPKSSPAGSETTAARTKTPTDILVGRGGVDSVFTHGVETAEEISDRVHMARHFMDAMSHSSRVCDSGIAVERTLSPPRSPSPSPMTTPSGTLDLTKPTVGTNDSKRTSSDLVSSSSALESSNLPVDLSADASRQPDSSAVHFRTPSDVSVRSNSTRSPSTTGSPVTSLIIDCFPGSPVLLLSNAVSSPVATSMSDTATSAPSDVDDSDHANMSRRQSMSPAISVGETVSTDIDDDLMNEALMMSADVSGDQLGKL